MRIGFLGGTGTGKSSLINALLGQGPVLPRSEESASTAVPVEISFNDHDNSDATFRAVIEGITRAEFKKELEELYSDKETWDSGADGEDDEQDFEILQRMNVTLSKLKCLFPDIQETSDLKKYSVDKILDNPQVRDVLEQFKSVQTSDLDDFSRTIKFYIDASNAKGGASGPLSVWPLVKVVKLYVKSDLLKTGIILVDLPGSHDTSAARCAVTENYRKNLTISCVMAPAVRAASDKAAHDRLNDINRQNMQFDGLYTSESLFFVITKIDELMNVDAYIRDHPNLKENLTADVERVVADKRRIAELQSDLKKDGKIYETHVNCLQRIQSSLPKLEARVEKILNKMAPSGLKRKRVLNDEAGKPSNAPSESPLLTKCKPRLVFCYKCPERRRDQVAKCAECSSRGTKHSQKTRA